jgi:hypothetical protein
VAVAGLTLGLATILPWLESEVFIRDPVREGVRLTLGLGVVVTGLLVLVLGIAEARRAVAGRGLPVASMVVALVALGAAVFVTLAPEATITTFEAGRIATELDLAADPVRDTIEAAFESGAATAKPAIGVYLAVAASLAALAGSVWGISAARRAEDD